MLPFRPSPSIAYPTPCRQPPAVLSARSCSQSTVPSSRIFRSSTQPVASVPSSKSSTQTTSAVPLAHPTCSRHPVIQIVHPTYCRCPFIQIAHPDSVATLAKSSRSALRGGPSSRSAFCRDLSSRSGQAQAREASRALNEMNGKLIGRKPLYVAVVQRKEDRKARLQAHFAQIRSPGAMAPLLARILGYHPRAPRLAPQQLYFGQGTPERLKGRGLGSKYKWNSVENY